jgi:hypothetical protein
MTTSTFTDAIREQLESTIKAEFPAHQPGVPMAFANTRFDVPDGGPWIHAIVIPGMARRCSLGDNTEFEVPGVVNVTCMVPEHQGTKQARQLADSVSLVLLDRQIALPAGGHITTYEANFRDRGVINGWYTVNVLVSFRARVKLVR